MNLSAFTGRRTPISGVMALMFFIVALVPFATSAISVDKLQYTSGETVNVSCSDNGNKYELYDITSGIDGLIANDGDLGLNDCSDDASLAFSAGIIDHTYALVETYTPACQGHDYGACVANVFGNLAGAAQFTVGDVSIDKPPPDDGSGGSGGGPVPSEGPDQNTYQEGDPVNFYCPDPSISLEVYDITDGVDGLAINGGDVGTFDCGQPAVLNLPTTADHSYAVLEVGNHACSGNDYGACRANVLGNYNGGEFHFAVTARPDTRTSVISYPPEVHVLSPKSGAIYSHTGTIKYSVTDQNDSGDADLKARLGLGATPVSIYYTDKIGDWDYSYINPQDKILIAQNIPNTGSYTWNIKDGDLLLGHPYKIIVDAIDNVGLLTEDVSDYFTVDFAPPQFIVSANPPATRGEDVSIRVEASKSLQKPPKVLVTQAGGSPIVVNMQATSTYYEGVYKVQNGHDGIAFISVQGTDIAGNVGTTTVSGGTFAVGVNPPSAPHITRPHTNDVVSSSTIPLTGTTQPNSLVILKVNGTDTYAATSTKDGAFTIPNVTLNPTYNHGVNILSVSVRDSVGNISAPVTLQVKYNIAPSVSVAKPVSDTIVSNVVTLAATSSDANGDALQFTYQILSAKEFDPKSATSSGDWTTVSQTPTNNFSWDSTEVEDGQYVLRIIADDGIAKVYSVPVQFSVKNTLPFFRFEDGRRTVSSRSPVTVVGRALEPAAFSQSTIAKIEYSLNNGKTWKSVQFVPNGSEAKFSVTFASSTAEGSYGVLWRVKDSRALIGHTSHPIVIDTTAPSAPVVSFPRQGVVLGDESDADTSAAGLQTQVRGSAEAESTVTLKFEGTTQTIRAGVDGSYVFRGITLTRGTHDLMLTSKDEAGNTSATVVSRVTYDNAPEISFLEPKPSRGLKGLSTVSWRVSDLDNDTVRIIGLSYRRGTGDFIALPVDTNANSFAWDVSRFAEAGDYELRLTATDGIATSTGTTGFYIDDTPPTLGSFTLTNSVVGKNGTISGDGSASDALSGIEYIEYAITPLSVGSDEKKEWYTGLITKGYLRKNAYFSIKSPTTLSDGSYEVSVRAVDAAGNTSVESTQKITVDTTPPRVGSFTATINGTQLSPDKDGNIDAYADTDLSLGVSLEDDTASSSLTMQGETYPLMLDIVSGLWVGTVHLKGEGIAPVTISAVDKLGNAIKDVRLGQISVVSPGKVLVQDGDSLEPLAGVHIVVSELDQESGRYETMATDTETGADGAYIYILTQGSYKLVMREAGYRTVERDIVLNRPTLVHESFTTQKLSAFQEFIQNITDYIRYSI